MQEQIEFIKNLKQIILFFLGPTILPPLGWKWGYWLRRYSWQPCATQSHSTSTVQLEEMVEENENAVSEAPLPWTQSVHRKSHRTDGLSQSPPNNLKSTVRRSPLLHSRSRAAAALILGLGALNLETMGCHASFLCNSTTAL